MSGQVLPTRSYQRPLVYTGLLYQDLIRRGALDDAGRLPPVLPIVLYNGRGR